MDLTNVTAVRIRTADRGWVQEHGLTWDPSTRDDAGYLLVTVPVELLTDVFVEETTGTMVRFDFGPAGPEDNFRYAVYPLDQVVTKND